MGGILLPAYTLVISQPLAFGAFDRFDNPFAIIEFARVPAKSEFVTIPVKVFFAYGMKCSQQTTLISEKNDSAQFTPEVVPQHRVITW